MRDAVLWTHLRNLVPAEAHRIDELTPLLAVTVVDRRCDYRESADCDKNVESAETEKPMMQPDSTHARSFPYVRVVRFGWVVSVSQGTSTLHSVFTSVKVYF